VGGEYRSRRLVAPAGTATRPTSDKLRETLFNVLGTRLPGARFADLYAGSGAVGLEALSRGAAACCFAERSREAVSAIRANLAALQVPSTKYVLEGRGVERALRGGCGGPWDLVFLDPPYEAREEYASTLAALGAGGLVSAGGLVVAEHARKSPLAEEVGRLQRTRLLEQGDAALSFYAAAE
jgi:16S rRNA (guanine966-N2)-methyltransferase